MSVYHKWRTVFVQITKNASSAVHDALSNPTDVNHDHRLYIDILAQNDPELIESYFSFAVCRNPYDRFVSAYEYLEHMVAVIIIHQHGLYRSKKQLTCFIAEVDSFTLMKIMCGGHRLDL